MAVGSTCIFVGPEMTEEDYTIVEANQVCASSNVNSHLAFIKDNEEFTILKNYMLAYHFERGLIHSSVALGGTYDVRGAPFAYVLM